jgi:putative tRNA adenosine deaminase-associated protein
MSDATSDATPDGGTVDFAVAAFLADRVWHVSPLPARAATDLAGLVAALRVLPADGPALGLVSVADDFFVVVRLRGPDVRMLLSDATAAGEWLLAREVLDALDIGDPGEEVRPVGDLGLVADLGLDKAELSRLCADLDLYPDEVLGTIAERLGFGAQFERAVDTVSERGLL